MLHSYFLSSLLTISLTYSWYSFYGAQYLLKSQNEEGRKERVKPNHFVPVYMWDIYNNGINSSEVDIVRGIYPTFTGPSFNSYYYPNQKTKQLEFKIPKPKKNEILVKTEVRLTTTSPKNQTAFFQIYLKKKDWVFLDEKKISNVNMMWISLQVTSEFQTLKTGSVTFLILTFCQNWDKNYCEVDFFHPVLLLSYIYKNETVLKRKKRNSDVEEYEEETNRIWGNEIFLQEVSKMPTRMRNYCRRKPLYVEFSDIDYDSWIVAPSGYEVSHLLLTCLDDEGHIRKAFQCVGRCTFPMSEHLTPTKHAILQTLVHNISPRKASRACCVPTKLDPISVLYIDENGVLTYRFRYRDMVVAECGCR